VYLTEDEKETLKTKAIKLDVTMSDFMRDLLLGEIDVPNGFEEN
jgi:hypothetical protein